MDRRPFGVLERAVTQRGSDFGDRASYALTQWSGEPLLFEGVSVTAKKGAKMAAKWSRTGRAVQSAIAAVERTAICQRFRRRSFAIFRTISPKMYLATVPPWAGLPSDR